MVEKIKEIRDLTPAEVTFLIENLAALSPAEDVQEAFHKFSGGEKIIVGSVIQQVQLKYGDRIKRQSEIYLSNIQGNPLFHPRVRLDIYARILKDCMEKKPSHVIKHEEGDYEVIAKADNNNAINILKLVVADLNKQEELERSKPKVATEKDTAWSFEDSNVG